MSSSVDREEHEVQRHTRDWQRLDSVIGIVMRDYDAARAEIRAAEARHERVTFWLSSGLLAATAACFTEFRIGFAFIPLVILAYYAHRLYSHTLHVKTLSQWVMRIEDLVDRLLGTDGLLDWERTFVRHKLKSFSVSSFLSPHYVAEVFLLLPSIVVFAISVCYAPGAVAETLKLSPVFSAILIWCAYPMLFLALIILSLACSGTKALEQARQLSVERTFQSLVSAIGLDADTCASKGDGEGQQRDKPEGCQP